MLWRQRVVGPKYIFSVDLIQKYYTVKITFLGPLPTEKLKKADFTQSLTLPGRFVFLLPLK